ncbi:hypothetical protein IWQ61_003673 [Dispira simplex]|nr:hypothetical protein IWQ61_003673 [Dispira simplex]
MSIPPNRTHHPSLCPYPITDVPKESIGPRSSASTVPQPINSNLPDAEGPLGPELWVHCNKCMLSNTETFWLTECAHILCPTCVTGGSATGTTCLPAGHVPELRCPVCQAVCAGTLINDQLPPFVQRYFFTMDQLLDDHRDVVKFQLRNTTRLVRHLLRTIERQRQVLRKAKDELLHMKDLRARIRELQAEKTELSKRLHLNTTGQRFPRVGGTVNIPFPGRPGSMGPDMRTTISNAHPNHRPFAFRDTIAMDPGMSRQMAPPTNPNQTIYSSSSIGAPQQHAHWAAPPSTYPPINHYQ